MNVQRLVDVIVSNMEHSGATRARLSEKNVNHALGVGNFPFASYLLIQNQLELRGFSFTHRVDGGGFIVLRLSSFWGSKTMELKSMKDICDPEGWQMRAELLKEEGNENVG
jgi:hypothetical protein